MQKIMMMTILLLLGLNILTPPAHAHSVLMDSNPKEGEIVTEGLAEITLEFNTKIERGSTFHVATESGEKFSPTNIEIDGASVVGTFNPILPNGSYTLDYAAIGSDGHQIAGHYSFEVLVAEFQNTEESKEETKAQDSTEKSKLETSNGDSSDEEAEQHNEVKEQQVNEANNQSQPNWLLLLSILFILVIIVATTTFVLKNKSKENH